MADDGVIELDPPGTRVSFAQNGEDVRLWRAFEDVAVGFYVEVGGWDPEQHSITRSFYGRGWSGLVIEPVAENADRYGRRRPRDVVRQIAVGQEAGPAQLNVFPGTGLSTLDGGHAQRHVEAGFEVEPRQVIVERLSEVLDALAPAEIHFMTIDVEGAELHVLRGLDLARHRPWVLVVEATLPLLRTQSHEVWEPLVLAAKYLLAAFDGLNRFYVAEEHQDLLERVGVPPNVLDDYTTFAEQSLREQIANLDARCGALSSEVDQARSWAAEASAQVDELASQLDECRSGFEDLSAAVARLSERERQLSGQLQSVLDSRSWRLTRPLRMLKGGSS